MLPEDEEEIFDYLSSGICKGVGPATARRIVDRFGVETLDILEREPERLNLIKGHHGEKGPGDCRELPPAHGPPAADGVSGPVRAAAGTGHAAAPAVRDAALEMVEENPYLLSGDSCGVDFSVTDRIALGMGIDPDSDERIQAAVTLS